MTFNPHNSSITRLVQQVKDINSTKAALYSAASSKIQAEYDSVVAVRRLRDEVVHDMERIVVLLQAKQIDEVLNTVEGKFLNEQ